MPKRSIEKKGIFQLGFLCLIGGLSIANAVFTFSFAGRQQASESLRGEQPVLPGEALETDIHQGVFPYDPYLNNADGFWTIVEPKNQNVPIDGIFAYIELCKMTGADAVLIVRQNQILGEWYSRRYRSPLTAMSSTKSVASLLIGMMEDEGFLSVNDPVGKYLTSWNEGLRGRVTIEHLLTQTSGLLRQEDQDDSVGYVSEKNAFVMDLVPQVEPGTQWSYSNEGIQLLSPLMEAASGMDLEDYAGERLFKRLGMMDTRLMVSGKHSDAWTYADMLTTARDFARIGVLIQNEGNWKGEQIVSKGYLERSFSPVSLNPAYGYAWWLFNDVSQKINAIAARGYLHTDMYILEDSDLVIVRMQMPKEGFSGRDESQGYSEYAGDVINAIIDGTPASELNELMDELRNALGIMDVEKVLQQGMILSRNGNEDQVIETLMPILDESKADEDQQAKAAMTIALQYFRKQDRLMAKKYLQLAKELRIESLEGYWQDSYRSMYRDLHLDEYR